MDSLADSEGFAMDKVDIVGTPIKTSRIGIGTWAIGGWMWGGSEERQSIDAILAAAGSRHQLDRYGARLWIWSVRRDCRQSVGRRGFAGANPHRHQSRTWLGRTKRSFATPRVRVSCERSRIPCGGCGPTTSISIRSTGPTRWFPIEEFGGGDANFAQPRKDPRHRRQQLLG